MIQTVPPIRNRHLVREIDRGRIRELLVVVLLAGLLLGPLFLYVWYHMEWIRIGYELERLKKERLAQAELGERLRVEKASLEALSRVEAEARNGLGLVPAATVVRMVGEPEWLEPEATSTSISRLQTGSLQIASPYDRIPPPPDPPPSEGGDAAARSETALR